MCERNIPWSQQVDEASYENLASPTSHEESTGAHQSSMQFQYPPFNAKENQNVQWINMKPRKSNNYESSKKYGKTNFHNNSKRDDPQPNAWGPQRRNFADGAQANFNRFNKSDDNFSGPSKLDNRPSNNVPVDEKRAVAPTVAQKKTTWASIASQPAKLTSRTTLATTSQKKKGPGMPPPPMVPGKHDLDANSWDLPNNNPPPVPSPPPPPVDSAPNLNSEVYVGYATTSDSENGRQPIQGQLTGGGGNYDIARDDAKSNYNNGSYGRIRHSPNGHTRKNWSTQHPLHQNRQINSASGAGLTRRMDANVSFGAIRYSSERRGLHSNSRSDYEDIRDENSPRNIDRASSSEEVHTESPQAVLDELRVKNNYNPVELDLETAAAARFFVIKSYSEDDIHRSIKYEIWCSTKQGNKRLDEAFKERQKEGGNILLFFSVNGSGHFCGMAQMMTPVDYNSTSSVWSQDKWKGKFKVKWIYVKDVPNNKLRHIRLENNDNKSVTNSRDTQEVPNAQGIEVLQILHSLQHSSSIFDDFIHYEERQKEEVSSKKPLTHESNNAQSPIGRHQNDERFQRDRDMRSGGGVGGGTHKYFPNSGANFRDRNSRSNYHTSNSGNGGNFHRNSDYQHPQTERDNSNTERTEAADHGSRYITKFDYNRRDDRALPKSNNREQRSAEFSDSDHNHKGEMRFRSGMREPSKDNEHVISERPRGALTSASDY